MSIEGQLRDTLRKAVDEVGTATPGPAVRAEGMRVLARRRRQRQVSMVSAGLAAVVITVGVPISVSVLSSNDPTSENHAADQSSPARADIFGAPTRGNLANDAALVEAIRVMPWEQQSTDDPPVPPIQTRHVVYVGDFVTGGGDFGTAALVVGEVAEAPAVSSPSATDVALPMPPDAAATSAVTTEPQPSPGSSQNRLVAAWVTGPAGASIDQLSMGTPRWIAAELPTSIYDELTGSLVVIAAPGDKIEISARPVVAADATITRNYVDSDASEGFVVTAVTPSQFSGTPAVQYRVSRAGNVIAELKPDEVIMNASPVPDFYLEYLRQPDYSESGDIPDLEVQMARDILSEYGLSESEVYFQAHLVAPIPGQGISMATLYLLTATFPSGAVLTRAEWAESTYVRGGYITDLGTCADQLSPAGGPAAYRSVAVRCDVGAGLDNGLAPQSSLIVVAPVGSGPLVAGSDNVPAETVSLDRGSEVGVVPYPLGAASVIISDLDGNRVLQIPIFGA